MAVDQLTTEQLSRRSERSGFEDRVFSLLVVRDGVTSIYPLADSGRVVIGRAKHADIRIDHASVSREHAALSIEQAPPSVTLEDLGSANGTRLRGKALRPGSTVAVGPDDVIDLGEILLVVQHRKLEQRLKRACAPAFFPGRCLLLRSLPIVRSL